MANSETEMKLTYKLEDVLTSKQLCHVITKISQEKNIRCELAGSEVLPASAGLAGFLGDHLRVGLVLKCSTAEQTVRLFIKCLPLSNKPKAEFIDTKHFFRREMIMFQVFQELEGDNDSDRWYPKAYLYDERALVMADLTAQGYATRDKMTTFDVDHILVTAASVAKFHAAFANYETRKYLNRPSPSNFLREHNTIFDDPSFSDSPWIRAGAKLITDFLKEFSSKYKSIDESEMLRLCVDTCGDLEEFQDTLNVVVHRDLWSNNIMFKYENESPTNAVILDYQCARYGPPAFDLMVLLYLNTSRKARDENEASILNHYFSLFWSNLDETSKERMGRYRYDFEEFLIWSEKARAYGMLVAAMIYPYILMESTEAREVFDDPATYERYTYEDRSEPVVAHARRCPLYRHRLLEMYEEFADKYLTTK